MIGTIYTPKASFTAFHIPLLGTWIKTPWGTWDKVLNWDDVKFVPKKKDLNLNI
jgi:hypothetical protein